MRKAVCLLPSIVALGLILAASPAYAAEMAHQGAKGTLKINITVKGEGLLESGKTDFDSTRWNVAHVLSFDAPMIAQNPMEGSADMEGKDFSGSGLSPEDEAVQEEWDKKIDDCNGDEDCEDAVMAAMVADPRYQKLQEDMQKAAPDIMEIMGQVNLGPGLQMWMPPTDKSVTRGTCKVHRDDWIYGVVEPTGGRSNGRQTVDGEQTIGRGEDMMDFTPMLTIDAKSMTYKIELDANLNVKAKHSQEVDGEVLEKDQPTTINVFGNPPKEKTWKEALTLSGKVDSTTEPKFKGTKTIKSDLGNPDDPHYTFPITVTVDWEFTPES